MTSLNPLLIVFLMCHDYTNIIQKEKSKKAKTYPRKSKAIYKENNYQKLPLMLN